MMILQDNDPHHMHPDPNQIYYFLILAVVLMAALLFAASKIMKLLDNRYERKKPSEKDSETVPEGDRDRQ
ncbi:MAG: hypothetical protein AB1477_05125 [Acidobacteriota bacterium]